jgi:hypothetical protein
MVDGMIAVIKEEPIAEWTGKVAGVLVTRFWLTVFVLEEVYS